MKTIAIAVAAAFLFTGTAHAEPAKVAHTSGKFESFSDKAKAVTYDAKVPSGAKVRCGATVDAVEDVAGGVQVSLTCTVEVEGAPKPSCVATVLYRYYQ